MIFGLLVQPYLWHGIYIFVFLSILVYCIWVWIWLQNGLDLEYNKHDYFILFVISITLKLIQGPPRSQCFGGQMLLPVQISMSHEPLVEITKQLWGFKAKTLTKTLKSWHKAAVLVVLLSSYLYKHTSHPACARVCMACASITLRLSLRSDSSLQWKSDQFTSKCKFQLYPHWQNASMFF